MAYPLDQHPLPWRWADAGDCDEIIDANGGLITLVNSGMGEWIIERAATETIPAVDIGIRVSGQRVLVESGNRDLRAAHRLADVCTEWIDRRNEGLGREIFVPGSLVQRMARVVSVVRPGAIEWDGYAFDPQTGKLLDRQRRDT